MGAVVILILIVGVTAALDVAALRWGVDSRPSSSDPRRPADRSLAA